jgi:hypothetical protein
MTTVPARQVVHYKTAISVGKDSAELQLEYSKGFGDGTAIFTGNA